MCGGVHRGVWRVWRGAQRCVQVSLQLIRFVNTNDLIGCGRGPLTNEIHAWRCVEGCASLFVLGYHSLRFEV